MIGVIMLILAAAGVAKFLSGDESDEGNDQREEDYSYPRYEPRLGNQVSSGTYSRHYRFDKETGLFEED